MDESKDLERHLKNLLIEVHRIANRARRTLEGVVRSNV